MDVHLRNGRRGGLMASALVAGSSEPVSRNYLVLSHSYLRLVQVFVSVCFVWILSLIIT